MTHRGRLGLRGDGHVERLVGRFEVLGQVDVGDVQRVAVVVEAVRRAVGRQFALQRDAGQVEQVAHGVLVLDPRQPAHAGPALAGQLRLLRLDEHVVQRLQRRGGLRGRRPGLLLAAASRPTRSGRGP